MGSISRRAFIGATGVTAAAPLVGRSGSQAQGSASTPALTLTCANYVRFMPIATGDVHPADLKLTWLRGDRNEMLRRATSDPAVHGGETSMAQHLLRVDRGDRSLVAIPVFPLRNFTARDIYTVRASTGSARPELVEGRGSTLTPSSLNGKRIGIYNWAASGATWYRHLVRFLGQDPAKVQWVVGSPDSTTPVAVSVTLPSNVTLAPSGSSLSDLLLAGRLDAFFAPLPPSKYNAESGPIVRLIPDFRSVEQRYFRETRCYPPQHVLVLRREVWERNPSVGARLVETFQRSEAAFNAAQRLYPYTTPWLMSEVEEVERLMGKDFHPHGLEQNRHAVDVFCQSGFEDGLTKRRVTVDEFFAEFVRSGRSL
jgi:4,5-dihydroxyphthalate decarboxylase